MPKPFPTVFQCVVVGELHGQETNNVLHFGGNSPEINWTAFFAALIGCIAGALKPITSDEWHFVKLVGRQLYPDLHDPIEYQHNVAISGSGLPSSPSFVANIIQIKTGFGGRRKRGRMFLPGVIENDVNLSKLTDDALARLAAYAACIAAAFIKAGELSNPDFEIGVLSRTTAKEAGQTIETAFFPAKSLVPVRIPGRMGSRKLGVGS